MIRGQVGQQKTRERVGCIKQEIRKRLVGEKDPLDSDSCGASNQEEVIGEPVIGEQANLGASDWVVIEIKNTVRNE